MATGKAWRWSDTVGRHVSRLVASWQTRQQRMWQDWTRDNVPLRACLLWPASSYLLKPPKQCPLAREQVLKHKASWTSVRQMKKSVFIRSYVKLLFGLAKVQREVLTSLYYRYHIVCHLSYLAPIMWRNRHGCGKEWSREAYLCKKKKKETLGLGSRVRGISRSFDKVRHATQSFVGPAGLV